MGGAYCVICGGFLLRKLPKFGCNSAPHDFNAKNHIDLGGLKVRFSEVIFMAGPFETTFGLIFGEGVQVVYEVLASLEEFLIL